MPKRSNTQEFIEKARLKHGDYYNYDNVNYQGRSVPVEIICPKHGVFKQTPHEHLDGCGCTQCSRESSSQKRTKTQSTFITQAKEIHGDKYDYSKAVYMGAHTPVTIICPKHGEFQKEPANHLGQKQGCPLCWAERRGNSLRSNTNDFIRKASELHPNENFDYSQVNYTGNKNKVIITCPQGHTFNIRPNDFLMGHGCPECAKTFGLSEHKMVKALRLAFPAVIEQYKPEWLHSATSYQSLDAFLPDYNIGVEYQGIMHFQPNPKFGGEKYYKIMLERDQRKFQRCQENGVKLFYISFEKNTPENYWAPIYKTTDELIAAIKNYISQTHIQITESDMKIMIKEIIKRII